MPRRSDLFARLSLDYADHPKIAGLSDAAFRTHIEMILYSRRYMTDGAIAKQIAKRWPQQALSELLANDSECPSLYELDNGSYQLHGFEEMQETRSEIEEKRRIRADAGRKGGLAKKKQNAKQMLSKKGSKTVPETETETETDISTSSSDVASDDHDGGEQAEQFPDEVYELCDHLAEHIKRNGNRVGTVGKRWHQAMDRLMRIDDYTPDQVRQVIDWSQQDEFWQGNILSAPKLREKFDALKTRMFAERNKVSQPQQFLTASEKKDLEFARLRAQRQQRQPSSGVAPIADLGEIEP